MHLKVYGRSQTINLKFSATCIISSFDSSPIRAILSFGWKVIERGCFGTSKQAVGGLTSNTKIFNSIFPSCTYYVIVIYKSINL